MTFNEQERQREINENKIKEREARNHNLQYAAIAIGLITFIILFLVLSRSVIVKTGFISFFAILGLLAVFEFINLLIHPYLSRVTNDSPVLMLLVLIAIGALLIPLHHRLEKWITKVMTEKNNLLILVLITVNSCLAQIKEIGSLHRLLSVSKEDPPGLMSF